MKSLRFIRWSSDVHVGTERGSCIGRGDPGEKIGFGEALAVEGLPVLEEKPDNDLFKEFGTIDIVVDDLAAPEVVFIRRGGILTGSRTRGENGILLVKSQEILSLVQLEHVGCTSSHFVLRVLQFLQPKRDLR